MKGKQKQFGFYKNYTYLLIEKQNIVLNTKFYENFMF